MLASSLLLFGSHTAFATDLDQLVVDYLDESQLTGISIALADGAEIETASAGYLDIDQAVPAELVDEMTTGSNVEPAYGLGISVETDDGGKWYGHTGGVDGFEVDFRYYPERGLTLAYAANGSTDSEVSLLEHAAEQ